MNIPTYDKEITALLVVGYEVTVIKDATADYSDEMMRAALDLNIPNYASAIIATEEIVASISAAV